MLEFEDLPFGERPDLTPYLVHLTRGTKDGASAFENLVQILKVGTLHGSTKKGFIHGPNPAVCLMDVPFASLKYIFAKNIIGKNGPRYEPYGIFLSKKAAYKRGCRPVLYLSREEEVISLNIPEKERWRVVRLEVSAKKKWTSWIHEREWRCKNELELPANPYGVLVRRAKDAVKLQQMIQDAPDEFAVTPRSIIPLEVICQGLL